MARSLLFTPAMHSFFDLLAARVKPHGLIAALVTATGWCAIPAQAQDGLEACGNIHACVHCRQAMSRITIEEVEDAVHRSLKRKEVAA